MPSQFIQNQRQRFSSWWNSPIRKRDRLAGAVIGAMACFWIVSLGRLAFSAPPASLSQLALWALGGAALGAAFGARYPKLATCLLLPFSTFGVSS
ncbi:MULTISPECIES: hypothetical protein [unclassified Pseudomonas]|uniref:hypothetical protein n=1 Tax=unclassified Pseudomonas TaxID=196821 RepID=UPI002447883E|nr:MULTISPECIES: hypothetical protein [unclassified Pseudomonas]MDG9922695.1 hypothetical protein [Pseudomonas sp. GD04045]MDH0033172.1 hypothetical protein [Pseudomonas sp. GD04019]